MTLQLGDIGLLIPVMARILSALMTAPIFSQRNVPAAVKIVLAAFLAWLLVSPGGIPNRAPAAAVPWLLGLGGEVLVGLLLGILSSLAFWAVNMAGELVGLQMGWGFPATLHASFDTSPAPTGQLYAMLAILVFLCTNGYQWWLKALADTFTAAPPFALVMNGLQVDRMVSLMSALFAGAIQLALPILGTMIFVEVVLGFLSRIMPQFNAWAFGMPLKIGVGLAALWLTLPLLMSLVEHSLGQTPLVMRTLLP